MSKTTKKQYSNYSKILKADKDRVLAELDRIKKQAIRLNPTLEKMVEERGEAETVKIFSRLPFDIDDENIESFKGLGVVMCNKSYFVYDEKTDTYKTKTGEPIPKVTINSLKGEFSFDLRDIVGIEKRIKSDYPAAVSAARSNMSSRLQWGKSFCSEDTLLENIEQARKVGNMKLVEVYENEMTALGYLNKVSDMKALGYSESESEQEKKTEVMITTELEQNSLNRLACIIAPKNHPNEALKGVYVDGEYLVASAGPNLVRIKDASYQAESGKTLDPLTGKHLNVIYPDFKRVIANAENKVGKFSMANIDDLIYTVDEALSGLFKGVELCKMVLNLNNDITYHCHPTALLNILKPLKAYGAKTITARYTSQKEHLLFYTNNANIGAILPLYVASEGYVLSKPFLFSSVSEQPIVQDQQIQQETPQNVQPIQRVLSIDIETYSPVDLKKSGLYKYVEHPEFEILLFAYAFDNDPVTVVDLAMFEDLPVEVFMALPDPTVLKKAHNANFERICISKFLGVSLPVNQWECTMIKSAMVGLPFSLDAVGKVLKLDKAKMSEGKTLIKYFSSPCKPTKVNGQRERNFPHHDLEKWNTYKLYNGRDVEAESEISQKISFYQIPETEKRLYALDQVINDRGVMIDRQFVENAIQMDAEYKERLTSEMSDLTDLNNPNSVAQLKAWLSEETGEDVTSLTKEAISTMLKNTPSEEVKQVLKNRQEMAKTSVKKYQAMMEMVCSDGRIRGLAQFYGANRTGRWAGRGVQLQNLPQNHLADLDLARQLVAENDLEMLEILFGNVPDTLSQLIRTAFIPKPGNTFNVADFSAIEARVIAWLANEKWRLDVFATHGKIYEASASQMFKVPIESIVKGSPLRQKGKVSELALGYQGGPGALEKMGALKMGIAKEELQGLVDAWRASNPNIVDLWKTVDNAAKKAIKENTTVGIRHGISFEGRGNVMYIKLPSGRRLSYWKATIGENKFGSESIVYEGMNQTTKQWGLQETYGGKLVENIVQAIARDCLAYSMLALDKAGHEIVFHVHDEVIIEAPEGSKVDQVCEIMGQPIPWAKGLLLKADGYETKYYRKD